MKIEFKAKPLALLQKHFASKEETRYYLAGVSFEAHPAGGVIAIATDGQVLAAYHDPNGSIEGDENDMPGRVLIELTPAVAGASKVSVDRVKIAAGPADANKPATVEMIGHHGEEVGRCFATRIDGAFPDWRRVVPASTVFRDGSGPGFSDHVMRRLVAAAAGCAETRSRAVGMAIYVSGKGGTGPALVRVDDPQFLIVAMPYRAELAKELPRWYLDEKGGKK